MAIRDAATAVSEAQADVAVEQASLLHEVRQLLTPEQREQAREMIQRHREFTESGERGFRGRHRFHGPRGDGDGTQELDD